jgi:hypothetical protein
MATSPAWRQRTLNKLWAASFAAALAMGSNAAWAQSPAPAPAYSDLVRMRQANPASQEAIPNLPAPSPVPTLPDAMPAAPEEEPGFAVPSYVHTRNKEDDASSRLSDVAIGIQPIPERPRLLVELNGLFLGPGFLSEGIQLPTGEIIRPSLWVFGTNQFGYNWFDNRNNIKNVSEIVERLDFFTQLNFSGTERIVYGIRPFDQERKVAGVSRRIYTSYEFDLDKGINGTNGNIETLFFEGDFGQIFPRLDPYDTKMLDYGFSVGRQPLLIQDGLLINANRLDAVTVTRNTLNGYGNLNCRTTGMYAWNQVHRNDDNLDPNARLLGLFNESDYKETTVNVDLVYLNSTPKTGSAFYAAASGIQRLDFLETEWSTAFHVLTSVPTNQQTPATGRGTLLFGQASMSPHGSPDLIYVTGFWAIDKFSSAARNPEVGGPLGQVGILFASPAFGRFGAPLSNQATRAAGGAIGYQIFLDQTRKQLIFEVGGRKNTEDAPSTGQIGFGARYQQACGQHFIFLLDSFVAKQEKFDVSSGARVSVIIKF